jgi:hypothetical protein
VPLVFSVGTVQLRVALPVVGAVTETMALCDAEPPVPLQVTEYFVVAVSAPVLREPLVGSAPLQPPEAMQVVALVADHVSIEAAPFATVAGLAVNVTAGGCVLTVTVAVWAALPPDPVQVKV